jgi:hypothetical protein
LRFVNSGPASKNSNHSDDLFSILGEWEAIMRLLEKLSVDHHTVDIYECKND